MSKEKFAINVKQECADEYYAHYECLLERLRKNISMDMLAHIFKDMVVPAIDKARELDRAGRADSEVEL